MDTIPPARPGAPGDADQPGCPAVAPGVPFPAFGQAMRAGMAAAGIASQRGLARLAGLPPDEVQRYCAGLRLPTLPRLAALVRGAGLDAASLLAAVPTPKEPTRCPLKN